MCWPLPPPPSPTSTTTAAVVVEELQEQLLAREEELTRREEALPAWEKVKISEKTLVKVNTDLDTEWAKAEATQKECLDKMEAHTAHAKHSLGIAIRCWGRRRSSSTE
jgi:hypothetical protein